MVLPGGANAYPAHRHVTPSQPALSVPARISSYPTVAAAAVINFDFVTPQLDRGTNARLRTWRGSTASISMETVPTVPVRTRLPRLACRSARYAGSRQHNRPPQYQSVARPSPGNGCHSHRVAAFSVCTPMISLRRVITGLRPLLAISCHWPEGEAP